MTVRDAVDVLLVEDNPGDVRLAEEAFTAIDTPVTLHVAADGIEALQFCRNRGEYADAPTPSVILLDLSLPRKDGRSVLADLSEDPDLRSIPVVVFTGSDSQEDIRDAYANCANAYLTKPVGPDEFLQTIRSFAQFWLSTVRLPESVD